MLSNLSIHIHEIPALVPTESSVEGKNSKREKEDSSKYDVQEFHRIKLLDEFIWEEKGIINRHDCEEEYLQKASFIDFRRVVGRSEHEFKHRSREFSGAPHIKCE